jgi:hypothetical protein
MSQPGTAPGPLVRVLVSALAACAFFPVALGGCGGTATFISATPPPQVSADAWYESSVPAVRDAVWQAMLASRIAVDPARCDGATVVGTKQQVPYVGKGAGEPAPGPLPVYRVTAIITKQGDTHVRTSVDVLCSTCSDNVPYEWEYPVDVLRDIVNGAREFLGEKRVHASYPPRHKPVKWHPSPGD